MKDELFVDKKCEVCRSFGEYILSKKKNSIIIRDINELDNETRSLDKMYFKRMGRVFIGHEALLESIKDIENLSFIKKILAMLPNFVMKFLYKVLSKNRHRIAKLLKIIKPKT
tara:strand:- start:50 stop:388 length:339 start_codon:yes stop_codon:yes gene_type:complete